VQKSDNDVTDIMRVLEFECNLRCRSRTVFDRGNNQWHD